VLCDLPYGQHSHWQGDGGAPELLEALRAVLAPGGVVVLASDKSQKPAHPAYRRADHFQIGHRRVVIIQAC